MKQHRSCLLPLLISVLAGFHLQGCSQEPPANMVQAAIETTSPAVGESAKAKLHLAQNLKEQPSAGKAEENYKNRKQDLPADFPIPRYPGSALELSNLDMKLLATQTILLTTPDSPDKVFDYYCQKLKKSGWQISKVHKTKGCMVITCAQKDSQSLITIAETRGGQTGISVSIKSR